MNYNFPQIIYSCPMYNLPFDYGCVPSLYVILSNDEYLNIYHSSCTCKHLRINDVRFECAHHHSPYEAVWRENPSTWQKSRQPFDHVCLPVDRHMQSFHLLLVVVNQYQLSLAVDSQLRWLPACSPVPVPFISSPKLAI
jgi:hypothetical protein